MTQNPAVHEEIKRILAAENSNVSLAKAETYGAIGIDDDLHYLKLWRVDTVSIANAEGDIISTSDDSLSLGTLPGATVHSTGPGAYTIILPPTESYVITYTSDTTHVVEVSEGDGQDRTKRVARYNDMPAVSATGQVIAQITPNNFIALGIDENLDGKIDNIVTPSGSGAGSTAMDVTPPTITISSDSMGEGRSIVTIDANDDISGVGSVFYSTDGHSYSIYAEPFTVTDGTTIFAFADDVVGNRSLRLSYRIPIVIPLGPIHLPVIRR